MRTSRSPRRSLSSFQLDMSLRDMRKESASKARVAAAAPEMLDTLKAFVAGWDKGEDQTFDRLYEAAEKARAVIAKAEGRTHA